MSSSVPPSQPGVVNCLLRHPLGEVAFTPLPFVIISTSSGRGGGRATFNRVNET